jgi:large subunit ribosomal protein L15
MEYKPVNLGRLGRYFEEGAEVNPETLAEVGIIKSSRELVVILGEGEVDQAYVVRAHRFSASAREKIEAAGGTVEELPVQRGGHRTR